MKQYVVWIRKPSSGKVTTYRTYRQQATDVVHAIHLSQEEFFRNNRQVAWNADVVLACEEGAI